MVAASIQAFQDAMRAEHIEPPADIIPDKLHRFSTNGRKDDDAGHRRPDGGTVVTLEEAIIEYHLRLAGQEHQVPPRCESHRRRRGLCDRGRA